jgi:Flp pilus assembly pilin Flp
MGACHEDHSQVSLRRDRCNRNEYGLIAAGISLAIIAVVNGLGDKLNTKFTSINNSLK